MIPPWCASYIGIPFLPHGRSRLGLDCYGLVRLVLADHFFIYLPEYRAGYDDPFDREEVGALVGRDAPLLLGDRLEAPEPGAVAVILIAGKPCHLGVYVGEGMVLHARDAQGVVLERETSSFLVNRIEGYYRVR